MLIVAQGATLIAASLEENSPFIPFDYVGPQAAPVAGPQKGGIELRGVLDYDGETRFSLYNPNTQKSTWVKLNDKTAPYHVDSYDPSKNSITVTVNGVRQQLPISKSKEEAVMGTGPAKPQPSPRPNPTSPPVNKKPEPINNEDEEDEEPEVSAEDEDARRRKEMSEKVYDAFKKYVSEKRGQS